MVSSAQNNLISASLAPAALGSAISTAVAGKTLQTSQQQGSAIVQLIESAAPASMTPQLGDPLVARATGLGATLDVFA